MSSGHFSERCCRCRARKTMFSPPRSAGLVWLLWQAALLWLLDGGHVGATFVETKQPRYYLRLGPRRGRLGTPGLRAPAATKDVALQDRSLGPPLDKWKQPRQSRRRSREKPTPKTVMEEKDGVSHDCLARSTVDLLGNAQWISHLIPQKDQTPQCPQQNSPEIPQGGQPDNPTTNATLIQKHNLIDRNHIQQYVLYAQSVMTAWTQRDLLPPSANITSANVVDSILKRVLHVLDESVSIQNHNPESIQTYNPESIQTYNPADNQDSHHYPNQLENQLDNHKTTPNKSPNNQTKSTWAVSHEGKKKKLELIIIAMNAWANSHPNDVAVDRAEHWLRFMQKEQRRQTQLRIEHHPTQQDNSFMIEAYHSVIKACVRTRQSQYLEKAMELLEELFVIQSDNHSGADNENVVNQTYSFSLSSMTQTCNLVLYGLANCNLCINNAKRAEALLQRMISSSSSPSVKDDNITIAMACPPDSNSFRQVVSAWTKLHHDPTADQRYNSDSIENAHRILRQMISHHPQLHPDASTFNAIMTSYLRMGQRDQVQQLMEQMKDLYMSGKTGSRPDVTSLNLLLSSLTRSSPRSRTPPREALEQAERLLENAETHYAVRPDAQSYNIVIDAWSKSKLTESSLRAESLLDRMERKVRYEGDVALRPDGYTFTSVLDAIARSGANNGNRHGVNAVEDPSASKTKRKKGKCHAAQRVFRRMQEMHEEGYVEAPTTPVYNALLNALVTSFEKGSLARAELVFNGMEVANTRTYNIMLKAYSTLGHRYSHTGMPTNTHGTNVNELLDTNAARNTNHNSGKNNGLVICFSRPEKARALLDRMETSLPPKHTAPPDKYSYTSVITAYARSNARRKAAKAFDILHRMIRSYERKNRSAVRPNIYAFNSVMNACAHTYAAEEMAEAFGILVSTFLSSRKFVDSPDHTTYGTFLKACARLLPKDEYEDDDDDDDGSQMDHSTVIPDTENTVVNVEPRKWSRIVETVFRSCCRDGQVGALVLQSLKHSAPPKLYHKLVGNYLTPDGELDHKLLPPRWTRNVNERGRKRFENSFIRQDVII